MRNFRKYVMVSVAIILAVVALNIKDVYASGTLILNTNSTNSSTENKANETNTANEANETKLNTTKENTTTNKAVLNSANIEAEKDDLPKTGENDVYIVSAIGAIALAIGGVAYFKSRKLDM